MLGYVAFTGEVFPNTILLIDSDSNAHPPNVESYEPQPIVCSIVLDPLKPLLQITSRQSD